MAQSLVKIYIHLIFHVKTSSVMIQPCDQSSLYAYIMGILRSCESTPIRVGGTRDHVHILCTLPKNMCVPDLVKKIKYSSNYFLKQHRPIYKDFTWQSGYGAFSVSSSVVENVKRYIDNQLIHHHDMPFREEFLMFLKEYEIEYDEKYVLSD